MARLAALRQVSTPALPPALENAPEVDEAEAVRQLPAELVDTALRGVFENSRKLALSASRHFSIRLELDDFQQLFLAAQLPCALGTWSARPSARVAERHGCLHGRGRETRLCDWYREAMDGMVMGLGESERVVRQRSEAYGDDGCLDVIFDDAPEAAADWTYAPVPPPLEGHLRTVVQRCAAKGFELSWLGYRAGTLFYKLTPKNSTAPLCRDNARSAHEGVAQAVHELFPTIRLQDSSPLAVYAEGTR
jgi:hypothetical protein